MGNITETESGDCYLDANTKYCGQFWNPLLATPQKKMILWLLVRERKCSGIITLQLDGMGLLFFSISFSNKNGLKYYKNSVWRPR